MFVARVSRISLLVLLFASVSAALAQNPDPCQAIRSDDAATLITLNQATVKTSPDSTSRCSFEVKNSFGTVGRLDLTVKQFSSHAEAVAYMKNELPFYFDKKPSLVKTDDSGDHVDTLLNRPDSSESEAVHGNTMAEVDINEQEASARAHPSYEYRLERLALQAAGATILPTAGLPPDPVLPTREAATASTSDSSSGIFGWLTGGIFGVTALTLIGPMIAVIVLYRFFLAPRLSRGRLMKSGMDGSALIESVSDTGVTINGSPQVLYHCTVTPADGDPYKGSTRAVTSRLMSPASFVGTTRAVKIDRANRAVFILV